MDTVTVSTEMGSTGDNDNGIEERLLNGRIEEERTDLKSSVWKEVKLIWRIGFPSMVSRVTTFGAFVVTQSFLGHVSDLDLAAFALVQSVLLRFINGILIGMSSATETLCGQAFGAKQYHMMGIYLQRSWIVDSALAIIMLPICIFTAPILKLIGEQAEIADVAGKIALWCIPFVISYVFRLTIQMFLQSQLKNMIVGWLSAGSFVVHIILSWVFVYKFEWGIAGAIGALIISAWLSVIGQFVYIFGGWCSESWKGFTFAAFTDLWPVVKLSVSSGVMICLELWYNSVLVVLAGHMKNATVAISAFSICLNICVWEFMIGLGFLAAACVRVSNELGKGDAKAAKFSIKVILGVSLITGLFFFILCLVFRNQISYIFTDDEEVAKAVSDLSTLLAFSILLQSVYPVLSGVAVGAGLQGTVAIVNICCYYLVGIPLGIVLAYVGHFQVKGLWVGMLCGVLCQSLVLLYIVWKTDWEREVDRASERLNKWLLKPNDELK